MGLLENATGACNGNRFLFRFISANDVWKTGSHQSGFYIPVNCWPLFFESKGEKGK
jgi:hypothetical protein